MCSKKFVCKMTATFLSAAMAVASAPVNGQIWVNAAEMEQTQNDFAAINGEAAVEKKNGSARVEQQFGGYDVNVVVSVLDGMIADLEVEGTNFDGTYAEFNKTKLQAAADGLRAFYTGKSATNAKELEELDAVSGATYSSEAIQSAVLNALGLESVSEESGFGLQGIELEEGIYTLPVSMKNATDISKDSMAGACLQGASLTVKPDGSAIVTVDLIPVTAMGQTVWSSDWKIYQEQSTTSDTVDADVTKTDAEGNVTQIAFTIPNNQEDGVYVNVTSGGHANNAYLAFDFANAVKKISGFGSQGIELEEGIYTLPVSMKNATDISKDSMAGACLQGASLTVKPDGSATVTVDLTSVSVMGQTAWSSDWKIYQGQGTNSETVEADVTKTDADGHATQITFTLPDNHADGVYVNMSSGGHANNAYLAFDYANAERKGFGSAGIVLEEGIYTLPVSMKNATDISKDSMAGACLQGAALTVKEDGSATVTVDLTSVSVMGQTAWSSDWKIYQGQGTNSETVEADVTKTDADGHTTQIAFTLPDNHADGVYVNMSSGGHANNAYLAFDYANAIAQNVSLADGIYAVEGTMYKPDFKTKSMADSAFNHNIMMTVENGKATLTINFKGMEITSIYGYLGSLKYYDTGYQKDAYGSPTGTLKDVNVVSVQKYSDGVVISDDFGTDYPDVVSFEVIPEALEDGIVPLQVFVPIMEKITAGTGNQNVYLALDLDSLRETTAEDELFKETEEAPENPDPGTNPPAGSNTPNPPAGSNTPNPPASSNITNPSTGSSTSETTTSSSSTLKVGKTVKVNGHTYKVTAKGKVAFTKCKTNAKTVAVPASIKVNGVTYKVTSVAKNAMKNNKKLTKVTLGKNVTKIGKNVFTGCKKLKTVKMASSLSKKKKTALKKLIKKAGISAKVTIK